MMSALTPNQTISTLLKLIEADKRHEIRLNANGGNSILTVYDPIDEIEFISYFEKNLDRAVFTIIDLNELLLEFVKENELHLESLFDLLQGSVNQIFKAPVDEEGADYFKKIVHAVSEVYADSKIPVLINTGVLYGAGIESIQIMEHEIVMKGSQPLIFLYPAIQSGDSLSFLGKRPASKYRCVIIS